MGTATGSDPDAASTEDPARAERARALATRRAHILGDTDLGTGRFLEIGPLAAPNVTPEMADVRYVDVVDREGLVAHYGGDPSVDVDLIPEIDFWLTRDDGTVGTLAEAVATAAPFHHVVACHVIEHVPDLVGWLRDVADVLVDGGHLLLAVPDLRFSFDARRPPATVGQVVQAHHDGHRTPSGQAVYDHARTTVAFDAADAWAGVWPPEGRLNPMAGVLPLLERQRAGEYVDCHVWPMTPVRLVDILVDLLELGLLDFAVERVTATPPGQLEFYATLRRLPRERSADEVASALEELATIRAALPDEERTWPHQVREAELAHRQEELERRLALAEGQVAELVRERDLVRDQRDRARGQRDAARAKRDLAREQRDRVRARLRRAQQRADRLAVSLEEERGRLSARLARRVRRLVPRGWSLRRPPGPPRPRERSGRASATPGPG
jgi:hypothetical protein